MNKTKKVLWSIVYYLFALVFLFEIPLLGLFMFAIPICIAIIKSIIKIIKSLQLKAFRKKGEKNYLELLNNHKQWEKEFIEVDSEINKLTVKIQPPYNNRLNKDVDLLVQNENKYRDLANEELDFCRALDNISHFYGIDYSSSYKRRSEFDDKRIQKLYSNILDFLCEKIAKEQEVLKEELDFLNSFETAFRLNVSDANDEYPYWKSFGKNKKHQLLSSLINQIISNGYIAENQETYLLKISIVLTYKDKTIDQLFPEETKIIKDLSLARTLSTKQIAPIKSDLPFSLRNGEICFFRVKKASFAKTRCEGEKYYPVDYTEECQIFVTNERFILWGTTSRSYNLSNIAGMGITDNKFFVFKLRDRVWPLCVVMTQPFSLQAIINRCINMH